MVSIPEPAAPAAARRRRVLKVLPIIEGLTLAALIAVPHLTSDFHTIIATRMMLLAMLAISFDLCWGYSGIMTFGQALFFGMAGYVAAMMANEGGITEVLVVIPVSIVVGLVAALFIGWFLLLGKRTPTIIFVALGTLTASYTAERLVAGWQWVGAANGLSIWDFLTVFGFEIETGPVFYHIVLLALVGSYLAARYTVRSQLGLVLAGMRQNEERLAFFGYRVQVFKALVFCLAGAIAGLSGGLYAHHEGFIGPTSMGIALSTYAVLYGLFGGVGTLIGPVLGAFAIEVIAFQLSDQDLFKQVWPILLGLVMLVVVAYKPTGLLGFILSERERIGSYGAKDKPKEDDDGAP
ncbi:MAG: branched-chain amino acid ABC transporter permease [Pseudomonadota bacterium]